MVDNEAQNHARNEQEFNSEWVMIVVVGSTEFDVHEIQCAERWANKDNFHRGIVKTNVGCEKIQVAGKVHYSKEDLWFAGDA